MADNGFYSSGHPAVGSTYKNTDQPVSALAFTDQGELLIGTGKSELISVNL
jgi:hypothetical protein